MQEIKKAQRKICLDRRNALSEEERQRSSALICGRLFPYLEGKTILSYYPVGSEVDVSAVNGRFDVAYPVIREGRQMDAYVPEHHRLQVNSYGIPEPDPDHSTLINKEDIDVVIVPCVGFDEHKNRLGHGGGYYDRYLKDCKALKICVAFEAQKLDRVVTDDDDIEMDLIITENGSY